MPSPTPEDWARIRHAYEHSDRPVGDICAAYGISTGTLRDRMRRWNWTRRREPIPPIGPAPLTPPPAMTAAVFAVKEDGAKNDPPVLAAERVAQAPEADADPAPQASRVDLFPIALAENADTALADTATDASVPLTYSRFIAREAKARGETADGAPLSEQLRGAIARIMPAIERTLTTLSSGPLQPRQIELTARSLGALTRTLRELNGLLAQHAADEWEPRDMEEFRRSLTEKMNAIVRARQEQTPRIYHEAWEEFAAQAGTGAGGG
ncbi:MAG: hypothetical protein AB7K64_17260 [Variibacter sp.]